MFFSLIGVYCTYFQANDCGQCPINKWLVSPTVVIELWPYFPHARATWLLISCNSIDEQRQHLQDFAQRVQWEEWNRMIGKIVCSDGLCAEV